MRSTNRRRDRPSAAGAPSGRSGTCYVRSPRRTGIKHPRFRCCVEEERNQHCVPRDVVTLECRRSAATRLPCPRVAWSGIQEADAVGQFPIRAAPCRHPGLDAREVEVSAGEVHAKLRWSAALDGPQSVLRIPKRPRDVANPARTSGPCASRANGLPPNRVRSAGQDVRWQSGK